MTVAMMGRKAPDRPRPDAFAHRSWTGRPAILDERLGEFAAALLHPEAAIPSGLVGPDGNPTTRRFNVYRNNVLAGLIATLRDAYPAVARLVGDAFFAAMARTYVAREPPDTPMMFDYGVGFADFIDAFEPAAGLPYLPDVARIERGWVEAYHAAEAPPLDPAVFTRIRPDALPNIRLGLHPSLRLVRSRFPSLAIWRMNIGDEVPAPVDSGAGGDDILIVRPDAEVELYSLPPGGVEFIQALADDLSVIEAMKIAMAAEPRFSLSSNLAGLLAANVFVEFTAKADRAVPERARQA